MVLSVAVVGAGARGLKRVLSRHIARHRLALRVASDPTAHATLDLRVKAERNAGVLPSQTYNAEL